MPQSTKLTGRRKIKWNSGIMLGWTHPGLAAMNKNFSESPGQTRLKQNPDQMSSYFPQPGVTDFRGRRRRTVNAPPGGPNNVRHFHPQTEFSKEFLEYLQNLSKGNFEHTADDCSVQISRKTDVNSNISGEISPGKNPDGTTTAKTNGNVVQVGNCLVQSKFRPITVPRCRPRHVWDKNNRVVMKPMDPHGAGEVQASDPAAIQNALQKSKVKSDQIENSFDESDCQGESDTPESPSSEGAGSYQASNASCTGVDSDRPVSSASSGASKRVTFAADVINYERENKPAKKKKMPKRRRQGFPHPSRGIFVPPTTEIVESTGPSGSCKDDLYLSFNQVWTHPSARTCAASVAARQVRQERFHRLMNDLEYAHVYYNRLKPEHQNDYLIGFIFRRYILVLDLALTEGHLSQVEHLLDTIGKSVPVLQQNTFYQLYRNPRGENILDFNRTSSKPGCEEDPNLTLLKYALARISGNIHLNEDTNMSIETVMVKLCLELIALFITKYNSVEFRNALVILPVTLRQASTLLRELRSSVGSVCYIQWINNSAVQRDFRSILKNIGMQDKFGCKIDTNAKQKLKRKSSTALTAKRTRTQSPGNSQTGQGEQSSRNSTASL